MNRPTTFPLACGAAFLLVVAGIGSTVPATAHEQAESPQRIAEVISAGGSVAASPPDAPQFVLRGSLGQAISPGIAAGPSEKAVTGFWARQVQLMLVDVPRYVGPTDRLFQNRPNPFNPATLISLVVGRPGPVRLEVYDLSGRRIRTLLCEDRPAGPHEVEWDGRDDYGRRVASGVYCYRLQLDEFDAMKMMVLVK